MYICEDNHIWIFQMQVWSPFKF